MNEEIIKYKQIFVNKIKDKAEKLNDLSASDWIKFTKSWFLLSDKADKQKTSCHPATFPLSLAEEYVKFFTREGQVVLDIFAGTGTTLIAADNLKRESIGIDLQEKYKSFAQTRTSSPYIVGNALEILNDNRLISDESVDYIFTSPPYYNMLRKSRGGNKDTRHKIRQIQNEPVFYSDDSNDIGNIKSKEEYICLLVDIFSAAFRVLRQKKYITIIIQNMNIDGRLEPIAWEFALLMQKTGLWDLKGERIWCQENKKLGIYGFPTAYATNNFHHYCLTFRKI